VETAQGAGLDASDAGARRHASFPCIDGIRALAAFGVVLCHTAQYSSANTSVFGPYLMELRSGVQVFFVLSGFLLYLPFAVAHVERGTEPAAGSYFRRRLLRIYPAYWVALTIAVFVLDVATLSTLRSAIFNYALLQTYDAGNSLFGQGLFIAWTLVVEITFYCVLPLYAVAMRRIGTRSPVRAEVGGGVMLVAIGIASAGWTAYGHPPTFVYVLPTNLAPFALGILLASATAAARNNEALRRRLDRLGRSPAAWWTLAAFAWSATVWWAGMESVLPFGSTQTGNQLFTESVLRTVIGIAIVVPAVFGNQERGTIRGVLRLRPVVYLGLVSYGIYLWHVPLITWLERQTAHVPPDTNFFALTVAVSVLVVIVATASWYVVERPLVAVSHRGRGRPRSRSRSRARSPW
jgi:peptidoglycan/LPS O-acetylase OafA/YrhL